MKNVFGTIAAGMLLSTLSVLPAQAQLYSGGGIIASYSQECAPDNPYITQMMNIARVTVYFGELESRPTRISLWYRDGVMEFVRWNGPFVPSPSFHLTWARWFDGGWPTAYGGRPTIRVMDRIVTYPEGASLAQAEEIFLRVRFRQFGGTFGCFAELITTVSGRALSSLSTQTGDTLPLPSQEWDETASSIQMTLR